MDEVNVVQPDILTEIQSTAEAIVENVVRESILIFTSTIFRNYVTAAECGRTSPTSPGQRVTRASDLSDGSERSWNQPSPGSADSFPFAVHPRCENLIREDRNLTSGVHPYKNPERTADRFVRVPSPLSGDADRSSPPSRSPASDDMKYVVNGNDKHSVSASKSKFRDRRNSPLQSLRQRLQSAFFKDTRDGGCCMLS